MMIEDLPEIREQLRTHWQTIAMDLVNRGFRPEAVFDAMPLVGLAGWSEVHGKPATAERLVLFAQRLSEQVQAEAAAEATDATKN